MAKTSGFVLPPDAASSTEGVTFPGFPGVWVPGEAQPIEALGMTMAEAKKIVAAQGLPLIATQAAPGLLEGEVTWEEAA